MSTDGTFQPDPTTQPATGATTVPPMAGQEPAAASTSEGTLANVQ